MFPDLAADIERVQQVPSFHLMGLRWIAPVLGGSIRLTIDSGVWPKVSAEIPWATTPDISFGEGELLAHLLFSWPKAQEESRLIGHYDLLLPSENTLFSLLLPPDATRPNLKKYTVIYIYIHLWSPLLYRAICLRIWEFQGCVTHSNLLATCLGECATDAKSSSTLARG